MTAAPSTTTGHGPVELFLVSLPDSTPSPELLSEISALVTSEILAVVDFVVVTKDDAGEITVTEYDDSADLDLELSGLLAEDDILDMAADLAPGATAALFVVEHLWARNLATGLAAVGGEVLATERIPGPVVTELVELLNS